MRWCQRNLTATALSIKLTIDMVNPLFYMLSVFVAFLYPTGVEPLYFLREEHNSIGLLGIGLHIQPFIIILTTVLYTFVCYIIYSITSRESNSKQFYRAKGIMRVIALLLYTAEIYIFHLPLYVWDNLRLDGYAVAAEIATLIPLFILTALNDVIASSFEGRFRQEATSIYGKLVFHFRTFTAFALLPIVLIISVSSISQEWDLLIKLITIYPFVGWLFGILLLIGIISMAPFLIKFALGAKPLPSGELRERLTYLCKKAAFSSRGMLVVNTYGARIGNAFIAGLFGKARYIFFTDYILDRMSIEEIEAVLSHEIGHSKRHHILLFLMFSISFVTLLNILSNVVGNSQFLGPTVLIFAVGFWVGIFGFISRRFETEADIYGAKLIGNTEQMAITLEKVADINSIARDTKGWRHFSIASRAFFLRTVAIAPDVAQRFESRIARITTIFLIIFCASITYGGSSIIKQWKDDEEGNQRWATYELALEGAKLIKENSFERAEGVLKRVIAQGLASSTLYIYLGEVQFSQGKEQEAIHSYLIAKNLEHQLRDPRERLYLEEVLKRIGY